MVFWWRTRRGDSVAFIPRCGSTSLGNLILEQNGSSYGEFLSHLNAGGNDIKSLKIHPFAALAENFDTNRYRYTGHLLIREPVERFISGLANIVYDNLDDYLSLLKDTSPVTWNVHIRPYSFWADRCIFAHLFRFERDKKDFCDKLKFGNFPHQNKTAEEKKVQINYRQLSKIQDLCSDDYKLYDLTKNGPYKLFSDCGAGFLEKFNKFLNEINFDAVGPNSVFDDVTLGLLESELRSFV